MYTFTGEQPEWGFVDELKRPLHHRMPCGWGREQGEENEADLSRGVRIDARFRDPAMVLQTAYDDFRRFLRIAGIPDGDYSIVTDYIRTSTPETHRIVVESGGCRILAGDTEGIRRGIIYLEDEILRAGGPFLPLGMIERKPVIRTRISRCFFGPINRPPKNRDELADDVNYYPDEYLNRLAHDGTNGLWLTITFRDTVPSQIIPEYGKDSARRLAKLRLTVERCARYGIKIYAFCIEPASFEKDSPILRAHPDLAGHTVGNRVAFCTSTEKGQAYLEEATRNLFSAVPGLGGLIVISVGERFTHCYSGRAGRDYVNNCPRCRDKEPHEVLAATLAAMERGMHRVDPDAELISWPYSQSRDEVWGRELTRAAAARVPENVILMHNYESGGGQEQLGKWRPAEDYWLSYVGPSDLYRDCATAAVGSGRRVFAKLQVGCSHEVATVPHVPVPGNLYRKYRTMHELGVSGAMQCWYFGNYPSLMTKAAGELSFAPMPSSEDDFLLRLARTDWGEDAETVVEAWKLFRDAYENYPLSAVFGYYGPMHDGPVWPLYLEPQNVPLAPTWQIVYPPSGDRIGECIVYTHTLDEVLILCARMAETWERGVEIMEGLAARHRGHPERIKDIGVAKALGLQFRSGLNILRFYALREELAEQTAPDGMTTLEQMKDLVKDELRIDRELLALAEADSTLGFHSEAEGYKYFPEKIRWRMKQLEELLETGFPSLEERIQRGVVPFPSYTGEKPEGRVYRCRPFPEGPPMDGKPCGQPWEGLAETGAFAVAGSGATDRDVTWKAGYDEEALYFGVCCRGATSLGDTIEIRLEPRRLWPHRGFRVRADGSKWHIAPTGFGNLEDDRWEVSVHRADGGWSAVVRIPFVCIERQKPRLKPLRVNVVRMGRIHSRWVLRPPLRSRLIWGTENPAEFGWLVFEQ